MLMFATSRLLRAGLTILFVMTFAFVVLRLSGDPALLIMSAVKFSIVVMFYMHLKYDHRLFRALFTGPLAIAMTTLIALLFLLAKTGAEMRA